MNHQHESQKQLRECCPAEKLKNDEGLQEVKSSNQYLQVRGQNKSCMPNHYSVSLAIGVCS